MILGCQVSYDRTIDTSASVRPAEFHGGVINLFTSIEIGQEL